MNKTKKSHPTRVFIPRFQYLPILRWLRLIRSIGRLVFWRRRRLDSKDSASIHRCCRAPPHSLFTHRGSRVSSTWFLRVCSRRIIPATRSERRGSRTNRSRFPAGMEQLGDRTNRITCWTTKRPNGLYHRVQRNRYSREFSAFSVISPEFGNRKCWSCWSTHIDRCREVRIEMHRIFIIDRE